jgi:anti-sigma factor RsiW
MVRLLGAWRRDLVCRDAIALMTDYLEGALSSRQLARLERHLAGCDGCDEYLRQIRATIGLLGGLQPEDLGPETREGIVQLFLSYREEAERDGDSDGDGNT